MKNTNQMAYLRQLCCLGLGKDIVFPELLKAVKSVIPSNNNLITRIEAGIPVEVINEMFMPELIAAALECRAGLYTPENQKLFLGCYMSGKIINQDTYASIGFYHSDFYQLVWLPLEQHYFFQVPVYVNFQLVEVLWLFRSRIHKPFTSAEHKLGVQLSPYIAHALQKRTDTDMDYVDSGQSSMIVADTQGGIVYFGREAQRLLTLATQLTNYKLGLSDSIRLPPELVTICRNLDTIFKGGDARPPVLTINNPSGRLTFRAYWLENKNNEPSGLIGIMIEHQEPISLHMLRNLQQHPLSATQRIAALLLALGHSHEQIGQKLHIKTTTVRDHVQKIYTKLDIHSRDELKSMLIK